MTYPTVVWNEVLHTVSTYFVLAGLSLLVWLNGMIFSVIVFIFLRSSPSSPHFRIRNPPSNRLHVWLASLLALMFFIQMHLLFSLQNASWQSATLTTVFLLLIAALFRSKINKGMHLLFNTIEGLKAPNQRPLLWILMILSGLHFGFVFGIAFKSEDQSLWQAALFIKKESNRLSRQEQTIKIEQQEINQWLKNRYGTPSLEMATSSEKNPLSPSNLSLHLRGLSSSQCSDLFKGIKTQQRLISSPQRMDSMGGNIVVRRRFLFTWDHTDPFFTSIRLFSYDATPKYQVLNLQDTPSITVPSTDPCKSIGASPIDIELMGL